MFTGIVAGIGTVKNVMRREGDFRLAIDTGAVVEAPSLGESVAVDGVCLTVVEANGGILSFDVSLETINRTDFKEMRQGRE
ncbi:MAG: riboflavin synthase, partial [Nitrospinota bacterium]|nr:riboflavin synthase [Nitrospinota bacterium]